MVIRDGEFRQRRKFKGREVGKGDLQVGWGNCSFLFFYFRVIGGGVGGRVIFV